jgi:hypothetical protein
METRMMECNSLARLTEKKRKNQIGDHSDNYDDIHHHIPTSFTKSDCISVLTATAAHLTSSRLGEGEAPIWAARSQGSQVVPSLYTILQGRADA